MQTNDCPPLRYTHLVPETWGKLENLERTGWVYWGVPRPETVAEHIIALREFAWEHQSEFDLNEQELNRLLDMLEIHDWAESIIGDIAVEKHPPEEWDDILANKAQTELRAMQQICAPLGETGEYILELFEESEARSTHLSNISYHIDKIQADIKAVEFEKRYNISGLSWEFLNHDKDKYTLPFFQSIFDSLWNDPDIHREFTR